MIGVFIKSGKLDAETDRPREDHVKTQGELAPNQGMPEASRSRERGVGQAPSQPSGGANPAQALISDLWPQEG